MPVTEILLLAYLAAVSVASGLSALALSYAQRTDEKLSGLLDYAMLLVCVSIPVVNIAFSFLLIKLIYEYASEYEY